jgi:hypothetical protein
MRSTISMRLSRNILVAAAGGAILLGGMTAAAAQPPQGPDFNAQPGAQPGAPGQRLAKARAARQALQGQPGQPGQRGGLGDPARRAERLKAQLSITPAQEGAFNAWIQATNAPPPGPPPESLTTPQRLDRQVAELTARVNATKRFYNQLTPEQRQVFDNLPPQVAMNGPGRDGPGGPGGRGGRGAGRGGPQGPGGPGGPGPRNTLQNPAPNGGYNPQ